jgi:23S rRNA (pseudouridine1915-N3)-methyltransferase
MIRLLSVKSSRSKWLESATEEYSKKIGHFFKFELIELASSKNSREDSEYKKESEGKSILSAIKANEYVILFDEKGQALTSRQWAEHIEKLQLHGHSRIIFIIGGAFGVSESIKSRANETWSLSTLVLNHHVAMLVALEQIYRAGTLLNNKPYHND